MPLIDKVDIYPIDFNLQNRKISIKMKISHYLFFEHVEVVDDYSNKEIECKEGTTYYKNNEIDVSIEVGFSLRLQIYSSSIYRIRHNFHPTFESCLNLENIYYFCSNLIIKSVVSILLDIWQK